MRSAVRFMTLPLAVLAAAGTFLIASEIHFVQPAGLTVHEWGTFTSVAGEDGSAVEWNTLGCKSDLPRFVNDYGFRGFKFILPATVRMETPVLYFYSARELDARVKVSFPHGLITEWYPHADYLVYQKSGDGSMKPLQRNLNGIDTSLRNLTGAIEWNNVKVQPGKSPELPVEKEATDYYAARAVDAAPVAVGGEYEKFLFYRGVGRFPVPLSARIEGDGKIRVDNRAGEALRGVILFENRGGKLGYRVVGTVHETVLLDPPPLDAPFAQLRQDLETALIAQGLFPREAHAMVETWKDSWFEEGSRLIYIVPSAAVDANLPLEVEPAPVEIKRVFVGRIELITPETQRAVESAIAINDWATVDRYGRFLNPILQRTYGNTARTSEVQNLFRLHQQSAGACR